MSFSAEILKRYERQLIMPAIGEPGQQKLFAARVLVVGAGGLGSPATYYLTAAGVGTIGLVDSDRVELSNLQRQILHWEKDLNRPKVDSAKEKLAAFNPGTTINTYFLTLNEENVEEVMAPYDLVVAAVDNFATRHLLNKTCFKLNKPLIEGGVSHFTGLITTFIPPEGPCYNCLFSGVPAEKKPIPLVGVLPGVIGVLQANEALKLILGIGTPLKGRLMLFDALEAQFETIPLQPSPNCPVCGNASSKLQHP
ncbi:MAG: HesA/MoeB/ThiF family protein [Bacillota bacterium]